MLPNLDRKLIEPIQCGSFGITLHFMNFYVHMTYSKLSECFFK